jgi:cyanate permease
MSAEWFPEGQRTRPTALVYISNALGVAVTFIIGPYIVRWTSLAVFLYLMAGLSSIPFISCLFYFPIPPGERLRLSDQREEDTDDLVQSPGPVFPDQRQKVAFLPGLRATFTNYSAMALCLGNGIMGGVVNAYVGVLPSALSDAGRSELQGDRLSSMNTFAGIVGGIFLADLTDRFFQRYMKDMIIFILATSFAFLAGLVYTVLLRPDLYWLQDLFALTAGLFQVHFITWL